MKKTAALIATSMMLTSFTAAADAVGVYIGVQAWDMAAEGTLGDKGDQQAYDFDDEAQARYYIELEHPIPFIPNMKVAHSELDTQGLETGEFRIDTDVDMSYTDYTLYYELFDNDLVSFDFGFTGKNLNGQVGDNSFDEIVAMLYASVEAGLPFTGLSIFAEGNFLSINDHTINDYQLGIAWAIVDNLAVDVSLTAGYRAVEMELDDLDGIYSDLDYDGAFAGIEVHF